MRSLLLLLACVAPAFAAESPLDAPATPDRPATIRSEIRRAAVASKSCLSITTAHPYWTAEATRDVFGYHECMSRIVWEAAKNGTYSPAFELGVIFERLNEASVALKASAAYRPLNPRNQSLTAQTLRDLGRLDFEKVNDLVRQLNVTPLDTCQAAGWTDCRQDVIPWFNEWARVPKPK